MLISWLPIALYNGSPVMESHTTVVSLWFVIPTATISVGSMVSWRKLNIVWLRHSLTAFNISIGSCSTHPSFGHVCVIGTWWYVNTSAVSAAKTWNNFVYY